MKILFDNNILIDLLANRLPFVIESEMLISKIGAGTIVGYMTANTITNVYYVLRKYMSDMEARNGLSSVMEVFQILSITGHDCKEALQASNPDLEDGLIEVCALTSGKNYIVTRDMEFIERCSIAINPANLLKLLK